MKSTEYWQREIRSGVKDAFGESVLPLLTRHTELLRDMNEKLGKSLEAVQELVILNRKS